MYLSAERLAIADREVVEIFERTSIAWQAIPNWDTGDPGQTRVRNDVVDKPDFLPLVPDEFAFQATLAQLEAPTPDSLLAEVMFSAGKLAGKVDTTVLAALQKAGTGIVQLPLSGTLAPSDIMNFLIDARALVEDAGYRAPSCLITNTEGLKRLSAFVSGYPEMDSVLTAANINSVHRASQLNKSVPDPKDPKKQIAKIVMILIGRRERIAHGAAADASPGEEPLDLAVSVSPSLEVIGEDKNRDIEMSARISFVTRIKDAAGVVILDEA
jgi:hypothetical protein